MYRTNDPRFRRRLNEIGQTLESANETAQSGLYIFGQTYVKPCLGSVGACLHACVDAGCPSLARPASHRDRLRRQQQLQQRNASRGRAELSFDFYDDWDDEETDALLGWGSDDFDRGAYGATSAGAAAATNAAAVVVTQAPAARPKGMMYPRSRRKSGGVSHDGDATVIPGSSFFGRLFGGKALQYRPSVADLQDHPGTRRLARDLSEGEALLEEHEYGLGGGRRIGPRGTRTTRARSGTAVSADTADSYSSRGDLFPSDEEDDAVPLDDEFAMVLERRTSQPGAEPEIGFGPMGARASRRGKRPSAGSRTSTRRTFSTPSTHSGKDNRSRTNSALHTPVDEAAPAIDDSVPSMNELKRDDGALGSGEAVELEETPADAPSAAVDDLSSKEANPENSTILPASTVDEVSPLQFQQPTEVEEEPALLGLTTSHNDSKS